MKIELLKVKRNGFALVVTISMLVLLVMIAVGLLSLSSVSIRSSEALQAQHEARQNAKLSVILAIGQLQKLAGADTRITASAKLIDESNVEATGVWRSWEGTSHDSTGKPVEPDYSSKNSSGDPSDTIASASDGRFLGWLTSTANSDDAQEVTSVPGSSVSADTGRVKLVSSGSVGDENGVFLETNSINSDENDIEGSYAWWVTGDNSKALINVDSSQEPTSAADWQRRLRANKLPNPAVFELEAVDDLDGEQQIIPTRESLELLADEQAPNDNFYHLTTYNRGLLTNVATGGWRKDLSLLSENWNSLPRSNLPLFTTEPGEDLKFRKATTRQRASNALLYHWADYLGNSSGPPWQQTPPICAWTSLVNYMKQYTELTSSSAANIAMDSYAGSITHTDLGATTARYNFQEEIRRHPQIARIQWIFSLGSTREGRVYNPGILLTPVITVWNPYNVELSVSNFRINFDEVFPLEFDFQIGANSFTSIPLSSIVNNSIVADLGSFTLSPGATRIFGINDTTIEVNSGREEMDLTPGYRANGGTLFTAINDGNVVQASSSESFSINAVRFYAQGLEGGANGIGIRYQVSSNGINNTSILVMSYDEQELGGSSIINSLYPSINSSLNETVGGVAGTKNKPFATAILGLRMVSQPPEDSRFDNILTKGMLQSNPLQHYAEVGVASDNNAFTSLADSGMYHTINAPYDFVFQDANSWNDSQVSPDFDPGDNNSTYIVSGSSLEKGVTSCVMAELPLSPLQSLADLQHFDARNNNIVPPFQYNLIGNSSAHPLFEKTNISVTTGNYNGWVNDDAYILNHIFFDDWFVSSAAPDLRDFSASEQRDLEQVLGDFFDGTEQLPNRFYHSAKTIDDVDTLTAELTSGDADEDTDLYPFQSFASNLEVEGMFNINSVSVKAWRAILGQGRDLEVPYFTSNDSVDTQDASVGAFPRTTISGNVQAENGGSGSGFNEAMINGFAAFTDEEIEDLAEQIVIQIRKRGPFLSLAEFVNRQLTDETELALAGTIQRALDVMAEGGSSTNPFEALINHGRMVTSTPPGDHDYKFVEAAFGSTNFGVPGWVRQADILRPLAPIMSARDDTFTIRGYGDARSKSGQIEAQAWCEVVVRRQAEFVDDGDNAALNSTSSDIESEINRKFGRRYELVSFRWLKSEEV